MASGPCPECGSQLLYKDGLRYLSDGSSVQRFLCRNCGYRFSENSKSRTYYNSGCRVGLGFEPSKNLAGAMCSMESQAERAEGHAGATTSELLQFAWHLKKMNRSEYTIKNYVSMLRRLISLGAVLGDSETVREILALTERSEYWKKQAVQAYTAYLEMKRLKWDPPTFRTVQKLPFIPSEAELDQLISGCGVKTSTFLELLKETGMRLGEAVRLQWKDVDLERRLITLNAPEKNGLPRMFKIREKLASMLGKLPRKSDRVFNCTTQSLHSCFRRSRKRLAAKLGNPRLAEITFHTFRHWKATMEYHKTKDLLHVKEMLGHKRVDNTMLYIQVERALFNEGGRRVHG